MFEPKTIMAARQHAIDCYPEESCGYIQGGEYVPCKNTHAEPRRFFRIDPRTMAAARKRGPIQAILHSHPNGPFGPSYDDMVGQIASKAPWAVMYSTRDSASAPVWFGVGAPEIPLIGRPFLHGAFDCYTLIRHYYEQKLGIVLPEVARQESWWDLDGATSLYLDGAMKNDFVQVDKLQPHDVILMTIRSKVPNHAAVYCGGDSIMHHLAMRNSCVDDEGVSKWNKYINSYWRHKSQIKGATP